MWIREELENLSTQRLYKLFSSYHGTSFCREEECAEMELMKEILDKRDHLPRKQKKKPQGKSKRGTENAEVLQS